MLRQKGHWSLLMYILVCHVARDHKDVTVQRRSCSVDSCDYDVVSEPRPSQAYCSSPGWMWEWEPWWWWCQLCITPESCTRALWQSYQHRHLERIGGQDVGVRILPIQYLKYLKGSLTWRKILRYGTSGFTSHRKEGVLRIFIALNNPSPRSGLNLRPLGAVASTLTTTPPRRLASFGIGCGNSVTM
jgi:hypothetical protein